MVVVDPRYVEPCTVDLAVQRKSVANSNENFTVVDINGNLMFKIKDTRFSFHDRHILFDASEKPVLTFKKKIRSIHGRWQTFKGEGATYKDLLFSVKKSSTPKHETELDVFLVENKEETVYDCKVMGDWETKSCTIYAKDGSTILAEVHDKQNIINVVQGNDTFGITVYPEVDYVFIVALVVILTEIKCYNGSSKKNKKKNTNTNTNTNTKTNTNTNTNTNSNTEKKKSDSSDDDDDDAKNREIKYEETEEKEKFEEKNEHEEEEELEENDDGYDEDDYDSESYAGEPKYDDYNDGSSSSED